MKILFIQLPLLDHIYSYIHGNIETAPSTIASYINKNFKGKVSTEMLPFTLANFASDKVIIKYIKKINPDVISFTSYLWNIERNIELAKALKTTDNTIVFGGPELTHGSILFNEERTFIDHFISGEGEWFYNKFLKRESFKEFISEINNNRLIIQPNNELLPADEIVEPINAKMINPMMDGSIFLEQTRGCPYRCTYCYYSKNCLKVRELPFSNLTNIIKTYPNLKEIYLLSPTFNKSKNFIDMLNRLVKLNHNISLHTEMRTDNIDKEKAELIYSAGFRSLEVGLQTLSKKSLKEINRNSSTEKELQGILNLKNSGIDLKIGIIPGLPGDNVEGFKETIDKLISMNLEEEIEFYPLMILPGTTIRDRAEKENISFQSKPPYYYLNGWDISSKDIKYLSSHLEETTGIGSNSYHLPDFSISDKGVLTKGIYLNHENFINCNTDIITQNIETNVYTIFIDLSDKICSDKEIYTALNSILTSLPESELFNIVIFYDNIIYEDDLIQFLISTEEDNFFRRLNNFSKWIEGLRFRFFQISNNVKNFDNLIKNNILFEPVLSIEKANSKKALKYINNDIFTYIRKDVYNEIESKIIKTYGKFPEIISFEEESDRAKFFKSSGYENVQYPFSLKVVKY